MQDRSVYLMAVKSEFFKFSVLKHVFYTHLYASLEANPEWASNECYLLLFYPQYHDGRIMRKPLFLAHLSRRLIGELIGY